MSSETAKYGYDDIPDRKGLPLIGSARSYVDDPLEFYMETAREHGAIARYQLGTQEIVQVNDPEYIGRILAQKNDVYVKGEQFQDRIRPILGEGLLTSRGERWESQRRALEPAFLPNEVGRYSTTVTDLTEAYSERWSDGEVLDIHEEMLSLTVEVIAEVLFDVDVSDRTEEISWSVGTIIGHLARRMRRPVQIPTWVPTSQNREYKRAIETLYEVADWIIEQKRDADGNDIISLLQEADHDPSEEELRNQVVTLLSAGHETTAVSLTCALQLLATHPEKLAAFQAELDEVLDGRTPTMEDLDELTYTEQVMKESMRVYPPIYEMLRTTAEEDVLGEYQIPEDTTILISQWVLNRNPEYFEDPDEFRPERWTDEFESQLPSFVYLPFGIGPRRCIGDRIAMMETRLILATLLQEWEVESHLDELTFTPSVSLRPAEPVEMTLKRR